MSISEEQERLLSQLVDGELPVDQANHVLADVFDELTHVLGDAEAAQKLNAMLQLRRALNPWRRQEPPKTIVLPAVSVGLSSASGNRADGEGNGGPAMERDASPPNALTLALSQGERGHELSELSQGTGGHESSALAQGGRRHAYRLLSLATAALLGGILVAGGFFLGGKFRIEQPVVPMARASMVIVTPEQRQEIARAFTLHESVAGPLSWYAADDSTIQVAPAGQSEALRQPIAILLRLTRDLSCPSGEAMPPKTYVIVCRNSDAVIELPQSPGAKTVRLRLTPTATNGEVSLQYAIAADGTGRGPDEAALAGRRHVGLGQTTLGQLAMNDCLVNVDASAWVIRDQNKL